LDVEDKVEDVKVVAEAEAEAGQEGVLADADEVRDDGEERVRLISAARAQASKPNFESFRGYMSAKVSKLDAQFEATRHGEGARAAGGSGIFAGVVAHVNGFTDPPLGEIRELMYAHGGKYANYYSSAVTHVICNRLPDTHIRRLRKERHPPPVLKSAWVTECLRQGRLLPAAAPFLLERVVVDDAQTSIAKSIVRASSTAGSSPVRERHREAFQRAHGRGLPRSTVDGAGYASSYREHSRLHYIGTWRERFEACKRAWEASEAGRGVARRTTPGREARRERCVLHVDLDCFFAQVAALGDRSGLGQGPLVVAWGHGGESTAEVSSANYAARSCGVRAGMRVVEARGLCAGRGKELYVAPYEFGLYTEASEALWRVLLRRSAEMGHAFVPKSCDEAFVEVLDANVDGEAEAEALRADLKREGKGLTASVGVGPNMLLARLATARAKPDGVARVRGEEADAVLLGLKASDLPGVGWRTSAALRDQLGVVSVADLRKASADGLRRVVGPKVGAALHAFSHGVDDRPVGGVSHSETDGGSALAPPKSLGVECNYGVRLAAEADARALCASLASHLETRLCENGMACAQLTLKVMRAKENAGPPGKHMGMGPCDALSRSSKHARSTSAAEIEARVWDLYLDLGVPVDRVRGMGIQATKLERLEAREGGRQEQAALGKRSIAAMFSNPREAPATTAPEEGNRAVASAPSTPPPGAVGVEARPRWSQIDQSMLEALPLDVRRELERELGPRKPPKSKISPGGQGKKLKGKVERSSEGDIRRYVSPEKPEGRARGDGHSDRPTSARRALDVGGPSDFDGGGVDAVAVVDADANAAARLVPHEGVPPQEHQARQSLVFPLLQSPGSFEEVRPVLLAYMASLGEGTVSDVHTEVLTQVLLDMAEVRDLFGCRMALGTMRRCAARHPAWARPVVQAAAALNRAVSDLIGQPVVLA